MEHEPGETILLKVDKLSMRWLKYFVHVDSLCVVSMTMTVYPACVCLFGQRVSVELNLSKFSGFLSVVLTSRSANLSHVCCFNQLGCQVSLAAAWVFKALKDQPCECGR